MTRRPFTLLSALSLLLCILIIASAAIGFLPRNLRGFRWNTPTHVHWLGVSPQGFGYSRHEQWPKDVPMPAQGLSGSAESREAYETPLWCRRVNVVLFTYMGRMVRMRFLWVCIYNTYPFLISLVLPGCWLIGYLRRYYERIRQMAIGHCSTCGYDLRASKDRCPECGVAITDRIAAQPINPMTNTERRP